MGAITKFSDDNLLDILRFFDRRELELFSCLNRRSNLLVKRSFAHHPLRLLDSLKFYPNHKWTMKGKVSGGPTLLLSLRILLGENLFVICAPT
uniref:F-box domain-containing protein n=1 Tax=Ditylenchus dipsaci TaxID=166011 RepID=A0A915EEU4_9BILA